MFQESVMTLIGCFWIKRLLVLLLICPTMILTKVIIPCGPGYGKKLWNRRCPWKTFAKNQLLICFSKFQRHYYKVSFSFSSPWSPKVQALVHCGHGPGPLRSTVVLVLIHSGPLWSDQTISRPQPWSGSVNPLVELDNKKNRGLWKFVKNTCHFWIFFGISPEFWIFLNSVSFSSQEMVSKHVLSGCNVFTYLRYPSTLMHTHFLFHLRENTAKNKTNFSTKMNGVAVGDLVQLEVGRDKILPQEYASFRKL